MKTRTADHYKNLLSSNPDASVEFTLAAQGVYASRHGEFDASADDHNDDEYRNIARDLKRRYGENLTREQVEAEMSTPATTELRIRNVPTTLHKALKRIAFDREISLNTLLIEALRQYEPKKGEEKG